MDKEIDEKIESLQKYVPIIDFMINIDQAKYKKFIDIKKWIINKKRYPLSDLRKIEKSITTQFRNMQLLEDVKIPKTLREILVEPNKLTGFVDLCSDKEEEEEEKKAEVKQNSLKKETTRLEGDSDDDLEIIDDSNEFPGKKFDTNTSVVNQIDDDLDEDTVELLKQIDDVVSDLKNGRDTAEEKLFTRRTDFVSESEKTQTHKRHHKGKTKHKSKRKKSFETITLSSGEEEEESATTSKEESATTPKQGDNVPFTRRPPKTLISDVHKTNTSVETNIEKNMIENTQMLNISTIVNDSPKDPKHPDSSSKQELKGSPKKTKSSEWDFDNLEKLTIEELCKVFLDELEKRGNLLANPDNLERFINIMTKQDNKENKVEVNPAGTSMAFTCAKSQEALKGMTRGSDIFGLAPTNLSQDFNLQQHQPPQPIPMVQFPTPRPPLLPTSAMPKYPLQYKINLKDPRIVKQLQFVQNSTKVSATMRETASVYLRNDIPPNPFNSQPTANSLHQVRANVAHNLNQRTVLETVGSSNPPPADPCLPTIGSHLMLKGLNISYTEYKRRKAEAQQNSTLENTNNQVQSEQQEAKRLEMEEREKSQKEIRSILFSSLEGVEDKLESAWNEHAKTKTNKKSVVEIPPKEKREPPKEAEKVPQKIKNNKIERIFKELQCTMQGFNQIKDFVPMSNGAKRRSSVHARGVISEQLNSNSDESDASIDMNFGETINRKGRNGKKKARTYRIQSESDTDFDIEAYMASTTKKTNSETMIKNRTHKGYVLKEPTIKLHRLTQEEIILQNPQLKVKTNEDKGRSNLRPKRQEKGVKPVKVSLPSKEGQSLPGSVKQGPPKRLNNDCQMTEFNTRFCVLCTSKPPDLTNHYIRKHKTESYVSRLTWTQLDDLLVNLNFARPHSRNSHNNSTTSTRSPNTPYKVMCPFCEDEIIQPFLKLYDHFSKHTGEYAYLCSFCSMSKPFRADILSHQQHSKNCHKATVQIIYRYPPHNTVIHIYYCCICNFVQLNEANVLKHLREQHSTREAVPSNAKKCVLAAIQDASDTHEPDSNLLNRPDNAEAIDENIVVRNEALSEDVEMEESENQTIPSNNNNNQTVCNESTTATDNFETPKPFCANEGSFKNEPLIFEVSNTEIMNYNQNTTQTKIPSSLPKLPNKKQYNEPPLIYRSIPANVHYFGLHKCMTDDCYYSTDNDTEMLNHLQDHTNSECPLQANNQCPYCVLHLDECNNPEELVQHVREKHQHSLYQCFRCCYRSCDASNVYLHQQMKHIFVEGERSVYKCAGSEITYEERKSNLEKLKRECKLKIPCPQCGTKFYAAAHMLKHLSTIHNIDTFQMDVMRTLSCLYCDYSDRDKSTIREHLVVNHPHELPYICDHNATADNQVDDLEYLQLCSLSVEVPLMMLKNANQANSAETTVDADDAPDVKPDLEKLMAGVEDTVKLRLRKLTEHTGIDLDNLYRCPERGCSGYFSVFELWLRHMKNRHHLMLCSCPHCPVNYDDKDNVLLSLGEFKQHFENHRRHTYTCFHCPDTFKYENEIRVHGTTAHQLVGVRFEKITVSLNWSYHVLIDAELHKDRFDFLREILVILEKRLKQMEESKLEKVQRQWLVPVTTSWLEEIPENILQQKLRKVCFNEPRCTFRTTDDDILFNHMRSQHQPNGVIFSCNQCYFTIININSWDAALEHIKIHANIILYVCCVCSDKFYRRTKITEHIRAHHDARDVPVIHLLKKNSDIYAEVFVVFATGLRRFSSTRNCFCCEERNMTADTLTLHLKHYHKFILMYFCEYCLQPLPTLNGCEEHFSIKHPKEQLKLRCQLASNDCLSIKSLNPFQMDIKRIENHVMMKIKSEPQDEIPDNGCCSENNDVVLMEDDDVTIAEDIRLQASIAPSVHNLKCVSADKLFRSSDHIVTPPRSTQFSVRILSGNTVQIPSGPPRKYTIVNQPNVRVAAECAPTCTNHHHAQNTAENLPLFNYCTTQNIAQHFPSFNNTQPHNTL